VLNTSVAEGAASFMAEFIQRVQPEPQLAAAMREKEDPPIVRPRKIE
jgi:hypothetical protein